MSDFALARRFQEEAVAICERLTLDGAMLYGVKPWYCDASLIIPGTKRVFMGINPGGGEKSQQFEEKQGVLSLPYVITGYNSWLDDDVRPEGRGGHGIGVQKVFKAFFDDTWETALRSTACFNLVPFRTPNAKKLTKEAWELGKIWGLNVVKEIKPELIICTGNSESKSAWSAISTSYGMTNLQTVSMPGPKISIKFGRLTGDPLRSTKLLGLPHLARFRPKALFEWLERNRELVLS